MINIDFFYKKFLLILLKRKQNIKEKRNEMFFFHSYSVRFGGFLNLPQKVMVLLLENKYYSINKKYYSKFYQLIQVIIEMFKIIFRTIYKCLNAQKYFKNNIPIPFKGTKILRKRSHIYLQERQKLALPLLHSFFFIFNREEVICKD